MAGLVELVQGAAIQHHVLLEWLATKRLLECTLCRSVCWACIVTLAEPILLLPSSSHSQGLM